MGNLEGLGYGGKTVVVTGGSSGMGEQTARILGELGADVHIVDIQEPKVAHNRFHRCDLSDFDQVRATAAALKDIAPIDFLFPCAGLPPHIKGPMYCMRVNYIGTRLFVDELVPSLRDGAGIALISSDAGDGLAEEPGPEPRNAGDHGPGRGLCLVRGRSGDAGARWLYLVEGNAGRLDPARSGASSATSAASGSTRSARARRQPPSSTSRRRS